MWDSPFYELQNKILYLNTLTKQPQANQFKWLLIKPVQGYILPTSSVSHVPTTTSPHLFNTIKITSYWIFIGENIDIFQQPSIINYLEDPAKQQDNTNNSSHKKKTKNKTKNTHTHKQSKLKLVWWRWALMMYMMEENNLHQKRP